MFLATISDSFQKRNSPCWRKLRTNLAYFHKQTAEDKFLPCLQFWRQLDKNCDLESAPTKKCKMAAMNSSILTFQNPKRTYLANICEIICRKVNQNRPIRLGCSVSTHRHTHIHTQTYTHPRFHCNIYIQSKWLNIKMAFKLNFCRIKILQCFLNVKHNNTNGFPR